MIQASSKQHKSKFILPKKRDKKVIDIEKVKKDIERKSKEELKKISQEGKRRVFKLIEDWKDIMYQTGTYTQNNKTFTFDDIRYEEFGFHAHLYCPLGLAFKMLETIQDKIEDGLDCIFIYNKERLDGFMDIRIVTKLSMNKRFNPPMTKPWEIYIGDRFDGTPIIVDLNKWCQVLLSGTTGGGKSKLLDCALATQVYNHTSKDLWLFLIQLDKCDLLIYRNSEICKGFADDIDKAIVILEYLEDENKRRTGLVASVKEVGLGSNITDYNELHKDNKQTTIWIVLDEMASISAKSSDSTSEKEKKQKANDLLSRVAQYGRSNNIFLISCLQRPTADLLPPFIKSMSNLKISFRQSNQKSSEVSMDDSSIALDLPMRVAVFKLLAYDFLQTPFIDDPMIMKFIKDKLKPQHDTIFNLKKSITRLKELQGTKEDISSEETGKQEISYELQLKEKEKEIIEREKEFKKQKEALEKMVKTQNETFKEKIIKFKLQRKEQHLDVYNKIKEVDTHIDKSDLSEEEIQNIVEVNKNKNDTWVEWIPPKDTGKEKIK